MIVGYSCWNVTLVFNLFIFCSSEHQHFSRAESEVFQSFFGVKEKNYNKESFRFLTHFSIYDILQSLCRNFIQLKSFFFKMKKEYFI
jgi:hypothetical protein